MDSNLFSLRFHPENVLEIKKLASRLDLRALKESCDQYMIENFNEFASGEEFLNLDYQEVLNIISRDELCAPQEQKVNIYLFSLLKS